MKINDLVKVYNDPISGPVQIPEGTLGVLRELNGMHVKVEFPGLSVPILTFRLGDISIVE